MVLSERTSTRRQMAGLAAWVGVVHYISTRASIHDSLTIAGYTSYLPYCAECKRLRCEPAVMFRYRARGGTAALNLKMGHKLFLTIVITTGLSLTAMLLVHRFTLRQGLIQYTQEVALERLQPLIESLAARYIRNDSWAFTEGDSFGLSGFNRGRQRDGKLTGSSRPNVWDRISLLDTDNTLLAGAEPTKDSVRRAINAQGLVVGYLVLATPKSRLDQMDGPFAHRQLQRASLAALAVFVSAALAAALFARNISAPIRALARGTHELAAGNYEARLPASRSDELGMLAKDFNTLAVSLQHSKQSRQQWVADISHELRTPITVLQVELEALEDGIRPVTPDALTSFAGELKQLRRLVDDLHQLTELDSGTLAIQRSKVDVSALLEETASRYEQRLLARELSVDFSLQTHATVYADPARLQQLFANLMENAIRYTNAGGVIRFVSEMHEHQLRVIVEDSDPGVPDDALPRLFDRLFRVDRCTDEGLPGSGLGLAICQSIVAAHDGSISARHSPLGGLAIDVKFPVSRSRV
jgi:two-component system sensor histidine kinase BaeS